MHASADLIRFVGRSATLPEAPTVTPASAAAGDDGRLDDIAVMDMASVAEGNSGELEEEEQEEVVS